MNTMKWLLRREFWENKGSMFWAPAIVSMIIAVFGGGAMLYLATAAHVSHRVSSKPMSFAQFTATLPEEVKLNMAHQFSSGYVMASAPLFFVMSFVVFFYCLGALYDDRRDRSILFWKSLPISDEKTVLSKVVAALCVAPLITLAFSALASLCILLIGCLVASISGWNMFGTIFGSLRTYLAPFQLLAMLPVYIVWALPSVGWLLMVSAWARSKVFLWAVGIPLLTIASVKYFSYLFSDFMDGFDSVSWFARNVVMRGLIGLEPGSWFLYMPHAPHQVATKNGLDVDWAGLVELSWASLATPDALIGAAVGVAMIVAAIRLRRWREEG